MKKLIYSGALVALLLVGCGTDTTQPPADSSSANEQANESVTATTPDTNEDTTQVEDDEEAASNSTDASAGQSTEDDSAATSNDTTNNTETNNEAADVEAATTTLTLYSSNEDATEIVPFEVVYEGAEEQLVPFIFEKVDVYETNLIDYTFEDDGKSLRLNIDDTIFNVQGSAGGMMYASTIVQSYFANFADLEQVMFLYNGSEEPVLDHLSVGQYYTRADITNIAQ